MIALACCTGTTVTTFTASELEWNHGGQEITGGAMSLALEQFGQVVIKEQLN